MKKEAEQLYREIMIHSNPTIIQKKILASFERVSRERAIAFGRWKQASRYELMPSDYSEFMESITNNQ